MPRRATSPVPPPGVIAESLVERLRTADRPLPLSTLGTMVRKQLLKVTNEALGSVLDRLSSEGRVHEHPVGRKAANASRCFWHAPADTYVDALLAQAVAARGEWTDSQLRKAVPKAYHELVDEAVGRLITSGRLFASVKGGRTRRWQTSAPRVTEGLTTIQKKSLETILGRVNALRRPVLTMAELLAFLDGNMPSRRINAGGGVERGTQGPTPETLMGVYAADRPPRARVPTTATP